MQNKKLETWMPSTLSLASAFILAAAFFKLHVCRADLEFVDVRQSKR